MESLLSSQYMIQAVANCFSLLRHTALVAFCLARASAGSSIAARMAIIAITTNNSINVNPPIALRARRQRTFADASFGVILPFKCERQLSFQISLLLSYAEIHADNIGRSFYVRKPK